MWKPINTLKPGDDKKQLLCAWKPSKDSHPMSYEAMILWPDGVLTDTVEVVVEPDEMPDLYMDIKEIDCLQQDAARYRWLKQHDSITIRTKNLRIDLDSATLTLYEHSIDRAIDGFIELGLTHEHLVK
jgi:hypothetical protein